MERKHLERDVERRLVEGIKALGGIAYKFTSPQRRSVPDRLCVLPGGKMVFVECKRPGGKVTGAQAREIARLKVLGHWATVVHSYEEVDDLLQTLIDLEAL